MLKSCRIRPLFFTLCLTTLVGCGADSDSGAVTMEQPAPSSAETLRAQIDAALKSKDATAAGSIAASFQESMSSLEQQNPSKGASLKRIRALAARAAGSGGEDQLPVLKQIRAELSNLQ